MSRIHHQGLLQIGLECELDAEASHHLLHVMRVALGDEIIIFNDSGEFTAIITKATKRNATVCIKDKLENTSESPLKICLLQAVTRRERMDHSIQKATELGVHCIQPVMTQHCVVKLDKHKAGKRISHWQGISKHASQQSGRLVVPEVLPVINWEHAIKSELVKSYGLKLIFALSASKPISTISNNNEPDRVCIALGPVGGFSGQEVDAAIAQGFNSVKLGPRVLRSETATTAALTAVQMLWGDLA